MTPAGSEVSTPSGRRARKVSAGGAWSIEDAIDGVFFAAGTALVLWLGWLLLTRHLALSPATVVYLIVFWLLVAYVGLPRLQEFLAHIYVPDYFIGRTLAADGMLGDPVNLAFDADEDDLHAAMVRAGWTRADEVTLRSGWGIVVSSVLRRSYPSAPVSPLFVFGRRQSFAYEQEVDGNASQRHHVRFWSVPPGWVLPGGHRVGWLAAATYDRAVGLSLFTLQVTHKIDADIDVERDYVTATVCRAEPAATVRVIEDFSAAFHARNGGGDLVHTDGNLPVLTVPALVPAMGPAQHATLGAVATSAAASPRLPPPALLIAGLFSVAKAAATVVGLALLAVDPSRTAPARSGLVVGAMGASALLVVTLWSLTLRRHPWARTLLLAVCTAEAVAQLAALSASDHAHLWPLITTGASVLILIAVSSSGSGRWVRSPRPTGPGRGVDGALAG